MINIIIKLECKFSFLFEKKKPSEIESNLSQLLFI